MAAAAAAPRFAVARSGGDAATVASGDHGVRRRSRHGGAVAWSYRVETTAILDEGIFEVELQVVVLHGGHGRGGPGSGGGRSAGAGGRLFRWGKPAGKPARAAHDACSEKTSLSVFFVGAY